MLKKRSVVLAKIESVYNTDPTPVEGTDAMKVENLALSFANARMHQFAPVKPSLSMKNQLYGGALMQISFEVDLKGSGAAGTAPEIGPLLRACGLGETIVPATSVTYAPVSTGIESATIYVFEDGLRYVVTGCRGTVTGNLTAGQPGRLAFTFTGHFAGPTDVALASPTFNATVPVALMGLSSFAFDSYAADVSAIQFDMGNEIGTPDDITEADGFGAVQITGRNLTGSIDPLAVLIATYDFVAKWKASNAASMTTGAIGASAGNICTITMPKAQITSIGEGDRAGVLSRDIQFLAGENSGDDEISIAFT